MVFISRPSDEFFEEYRRLPRRIREKTKRAHRLFVNNPLHTSLEFKPIRSMHGVYSAELTTSTGRWASAMATSYTGFGLAPTTTMKGLYLDMTTSTAAISISYSHTVGSLSNQGRGFQNPVDLALDSQGVIYVLNRAGPEVPLRLPYKRISMCTVDEEYLGEFGAGGTAPGEFWWPCALAFDRRDRLYVSDEALNRVTVFSAEGETLAHWGEAGAAPGQLNRPSGPRRRPRRQSANRRQRQPPDPEVRSRRPISPKLGRLRQRRRPPRHPLGAGPGRRRPRLRRRLGQPPHPEIRPRRPISGPVSPSRRRHRRRRPPAPPAGVGVDSDG